MSEHGIFHIYKNNHSWQYAKKNMYDKLLDKTYVCKC